MIQRTNLNNIFILIVCQIFYTCVLLLPDYSIKLALMLIFNLVLVIISVKINGIDLVSFIILCLNLLVIAISIQYFTGESYGLLELNQVPLHYDQVLNYNFLYCSIFLLCSVIFNFKSNEQKLVSVSDISITKYNIWFNNLVALAFMIIAFPRLTMNTAGGDRFAMLLPGHAWNQLSIVALLFNFSFLKKYKSVQLTYIIVILWFLLNGERADIAGLIFGLIIYYFVNNKNQRDINGLSILKIAIFFLLFVIMLNMITFIRSNSFEWSSKIFSSMLTTSTTSDVGYLYNVAIDYFNNYGIEHGKIIRSLLQSAIPFSSSSGFGDIIAAASYANPGGEPFLAQPLMDYGVIGLVLESILDILIFRGLIEFKKTFFKMEYLAILCLVPRMVWYGRSFIFSTIIFFVPLMYVLNLLISKYTKSNV